MFIMNLESQEILDLKTPDHFSHREMFKNFTYVKHWIKLFYKLYIYFPEFPGPKTVKLPAVKKRPKYSERYFPETKTFQHIVLLIAIRISIYIGLQTS